MTFEILERLLAYAAEIRSPQMHERVALERIELQIDFQPSLIGGELRHEVGLVSNAKPVGVNHDVPDRAAAHRVEHSKKVRMQGRLSAGELHEVGLSLTCDEGIEHALDSCQRQV